MLSLKKSTPQKQTSRSNSAIATDSAPIIRKRMEFVEVDTQTRQSLEEYLPHLEAALPDILEEFYAHIKKWPEQAAMFQDETRMDYAKKAQIQHWLRLFQARFDQEYADSVQKIGLIHSKIGLEPTWYIGAYAFTLNRVYAHAAHFFKTQLGGKNQDKTARLMRAINQCVMIDMDMAISVYLDENKRSYDYKLNELARSFEQKIGGIVDGVSSAATELEASAENLSTMAKETSDGVQNVSAASQEASTNVSAVSSAGEEISASIAHVADIAKKSYSSAEQAVQETDQSVSTMVELKEAIDRVSQVTNLISDIAEQTNLLALNATIEAARAGDAGKGFAVVASEVKTLANETAKATEDIKVQVAEIIAKSDSAASSLENVKKVIDDSKTISHETAQSVEDQKQAISEIARNIEQASAGTNEISQNINNISDGAQGVSGASTGILDAARELSQQGASLRDSVAKFIKDIKDSTASSA